MPKIKPKLIVDPAWAETEEGKIYAEQQRRGTRSELGFGESEQDYYPEDYGKDIPEEGAWIILLAAVHVGTQGANGSVNAIDVPHLSVWYAMPTTANVGKRGNRYPRQAIIQTPQGQVNIWPQ